MLYSSDGLEVEAASNSLQSQNYVLFSFMFLFLFWSVPYRVNNNNNDRLTAFDPGQPG